MVFGIKPEVWLSVVAIIAGPLFALWIQRNSDDRRELRKRKLEIFRKLMITLKVPLNPNHVDAINMIPVEFHASRKADKEVLAAWRVYASHLNQRTGDGEQLARWLEKKFDLLVDLVHVMGRSLGYDLDKAAIRDNMYVPQGYEDIENQWRRIRAAWLEVLNGERPLPMTMVGPVHLEKPLELPNEIAEPDVPLRLPPAGKG
jgi:hypothetical protein